MLELNAVTKKRNHRDLTANAFTGGPSPAAGARAANSLIFL